MQTVKVFQVRDDDGLDVAVSDKDEAHRLARESGRYATVEPQTITIYDSAEEYRTQARKSVQEIIASLNDEDVGVLVAHGLKLAGPDPSENGRRLKRGSRGASGKRTASRLPGSLARQPSSPDLDRVADEFVGIVRRLLAQPEPRIKKDMLLLPRDELAKMLDEAPYMTLHEKLKCWRSFHWLEVDDGHFTRRTRDENGKAVRLVHINLSGYDALQALASPKAVRDVGGVELGDNYSFDDYLTIESAEAPREPRTESGGTNDPYACKNDG